MATLKEITVIINRKGETRIEPTQGFTGSECLAATKNLEVAIGIVQSRDSKPEMDQQPPDIFDTTRVG